MNKEKLAYWYKLSQNLKELKAEELKLRKQIFNECFKETEGSHQLDLEDGYVLKAKLPFTRTVDKGAFDALRKPLSEKGINCDKLVNFKPSLVLTEYRKLSEDESFAFSECLLTKPGTPSLEIVMPKRSK